MAEKLEQQKQYKYQENANLVISRTKDGVSREVGPTGESSSLATYDVETLMAQMGKRAGQSKPTDQIKKGKILQQKKDKETFEKKKIGKSFFAKRGTVLDYEIDLSYKPQTKESKAAYELLINFMEKKCGPQVKLFISKLFFFIIFLLFFYFG